MSAERPAGELRIRQATQLGVDFPKRTIELIAVPYEQETIVEHGGRMVWEIVSRGAFDGIERRPNRVRVNRDHDLTRTVGRAVAFHPSREEGLVAEVRIARTDLGTETLELADEGCLDASVAFLPMAGGEKWEQRDRVRMRKCWLGHIAMTPDPAYEGAKVLAVRNAFAGMTPAQVQAWQDVSDERDRQGLTTPNLDVVRGWRLEDEYRRLERYTRD